MVLHICCRVVQEREITCQRIQCRLSLFEPVFQFRYSIIIVGHLAVNFAEKLTQLILTEDKSYESTQVEIIVWLHLGCFSNIINMKEMNSRSNVKRDQLIQEQRKKLEARMLAYRLSSFRKWVVKYETAENPAEREGSRVIIPRKKEGYARDNINTG